MTIIYGEEKVMQPRIHENDAGNVWGPAWHAFRSCDGFVLEYDTGDHAGRERRFDISEAEFETLRADPEQFMPIIYAHGG